MAVGSNRTTLVAPDFSFAYSGNKLIFWQWKHEFSCGESCYIQNSNIKKLDGEIYRYCYVLSKSKNINLVVTNRRIMSVKEVEILGHRTIDWDYSFEDFIQPPRVEENVLNLFLKDQSLMVFQKKETSSPGFKKTITFCSSVAAQEVLKALDEARTTRQQQTLVRQKSERFIKQYRS